MNYIRLITRILQHMQSDWIRDFPIGQQTGAVQASSLLTGITFR